MAIREDQVIDRLSRHGNPNAVNFAPSQIKHRDRNNQGNLQKDGPRFDFSYSGIKTAVLRYVDTHNLREAIEARRQKLSGISNPKSDDYLSSCDRQTLDLVASFQRAMVEGSGWENPGRGTSL